MRVHTPRFGTLEIAEDTIVTFPEGLPGFSSRRWVIFIREETPMIEWLQSIDEPDIALMTMDPIQDLLLDYNPSPKLEELRILGTENIEELIIRVIVRNATEHSRISVNLFAPIFYNANTRLGLQLPLVGSKYQVNELWPPRNILPSTQSSCSSFTPTNHIEPVSIITIDR